MVDRGIVRTTEELVEAAGTCPVAHEGLPRQKTGRSAEGSYTPLAQDTQGVWQVHGFAEARTILRNSSATK